MRRGTLALIAGMVLLLGSLAAGADVDLVHVVTVHLEAPLGSTVVQGRNFVFEGTVTNALPVGVVGRVDLTILPPGAETPRTLDAWTGAIAPGASAYFEREFNPAQYFEATGDFSVRAAGEFRLQVGPSVVLDSPSDTLAFVVAPPPIPPAVFEDVTTSMGITTVLGPATCQDYAAGAAWDDIDEDGDLDLFIPQRLGPSELWINEGDHFVERAAAYGIDNRNPDATYPMGIGAVFADYDNSGHKSLLITNDGKPRLYHNNGDATFTDVTQAAGLSIDGNWTSASWADYNDDGYLDLFIATHGRRPDCTADFSPYRSRLFRNDGDGTFTDVTYQLPYFGYSQGLSFVGSWFDYDRDGRVDLYLANDHIFRTDPTNVLWHNEGQGGFGGWSFRNVSISSGAGVGVNAMGAGIGDYNRDGNLDAAFSNIGPPALMRNNGDGTFTNVASETGLQRPDQSGGGAPTWWAVQMDDFNNDSWDDLYVSAGNLNGGPDQNNAMYMNDGTGSFLDLSAASKANDSGQSRGVAFADFDGDGRTDMLVVDLGAPVRLFRNVTPQAGHWLGLKLRTFGRSACGASLLAEWPGTQTPPIARVVSCGSTSLASDDAGIVHLGLGAEDAVGRITITWPSGATQTLTDVGVDQLLTIDEP